VVTPGSVRAAMQPLLTALEVRSVEIPKASAARSQGQAAWVAAAAAE